MGNQTKILEKFERFSSTYLYRLLGVFLILLVASLLVPRFLHINNISNLIRQIFLLTLISYGVSLSLLIKGIDLSVGAVAALSTCVAANFISNGNVAFGIIAGLLMGGLCGFANGILITKFMIPDFITTFSMMYIARGLAFTYTKGGSIYSFPKVFTNFGKGFIGSVPVPVVISIFLMIILYFILKKTVFGKEIYATGVNKKAAIYSGVRTDRVIIKVYTIAGILAGLAGLVFIARLNSADAVLGETWSLQAVAACIIGGITFEGGKGSVLGLIIGALVISVINNCINLLGIPSRFQDFFLGFMIICVVSLDYYMKKRKR